jgi:hypothetical protein
MKAGDFPHRVSTNLKPRAPTMSQPIIDPLTANGLGMVEE